MIDGTMKGIDIDLSSLVVLTEAATGPFAMTASMAALAGAARVLVLARGGRFGSPDDAIAQTLAVAREWECASSISVLASRSEIAIGSPDIVTNLRGVRPLDKEFLSGLKPSAVIPLMFETWEFRPADIDLEVCRERGLLVLPRIHHRIHCWAMVTFMCHKTIQLAAQLVGVTKALRLPALPLRYTRVIRLVTSGNSSS